MRVCTSVLAFYRSSIAVALQHNQSTQQGDILAFEVQYLKPVSMVSRETNLRPEMHELNSLHRIISELHPAFCRDRANLGSFIDRP